MDYRGAEITFIPFDKTRDDPKGERGYCAWTLMRKGKRYGQVLQLHNKSTSGAEAWAKEQIDKFLGEMVDG